MRKYLGGRGFVVVLALGVLVGLFSSSGEAQPGTAQAQMEAGTAFRDCKECPEMVVVPAGTYMMGSPEVPSEMPIHRVTIGEAFAVGKYEVTFAEWEACVADGGCNGWRPEDEGWGRGTRPVMRVSWNEVQTYVMWLSEKTGETYRLLSEAEWEYVARAGNEIGRNRADCEGCGSRWDDKQTAPVGSFAANTFGLHDVHGNVWEWVQDCWNETYAGAPADGSAWEQENCEFRVVRGGSWLYVTSYLRSAHRGRTIYPSDYRYVRIGVRVARSVTP